MPLSQFEFFGFAHIATMGVILAVPIVLTLVVRRLDSERTTQAICCAVRHMGPGYATSRSIGVACFCFAECFGCCFDWRQFDAGEQLYVSLPTA